MMIEDVTYGHLTPQNVHKACGRFLKDYGE
jgi:hypothetical protein